MGPPGLSWGSYSTPLRSKLKKYKNMRLGQLNNYAGQTISLNQKVAPYFGVGEGDEKKIWLSKDNWCAKVPNNLTPDEVTIIDKAMSNGYIVLGKEWLPALKKDVNIRNEYVKVIERSKYLTNEVKEPFQQLVLKKQDGNYTASEIITHVMKSERASRGRTNFLTFLQDALDHYDGPAQLVPDHPVNPLGFIDTNEMLEVEDDTKDILSPPIKSKAPFAKQKALSNLSNTDIV